MLVAVCHSEERGWSKIEELDDLSELRAQTGKLLWAEADVANLTTEDIDTLAEEFGLHPLAVEDSTAAKQRPKLETYDDHLFLVVHQLDEDDGQLEPVQLACFIGENYVLTLHHGAGRVLDEMKKRWDSSHELHKASGAGSLLYTLLDVIVDEDQAQADRVELEIEQLEDIVLSADNPPIQKQVYSVKQRCARLRRFALPIQRVLDGLIEHDGDMAVPEEMHPLLRDIKDHTLRMADQIRNVDDLSQAVLELVRGEQADEINEISKKLSAYAAIFAMAALIAGIYGMNFSLVPDTHSVLGFWFAITLMVVLGGGAYLYFKRRGWL